MAYVTFTTMFMAKTVIAICIIDIQYVWMSFSRIFNQKIHAASPILFIPAFESIDGSVDFFSPSDLVGGFQRCVHSDNTW